MILGNFQSNLQNLAGRLFHIAHIDSVYAKIIDKSHTMFTQERFLMELRCSRLFHQEIYTTESK